MRDEGRDKPRYSVHLAINAGLSRASRSAGAATGPMQTNTMPASSRVGSRPAARSASTKLRTVDELVKAMASTRSASSTRESSAGSSGCTTVR